MCAVRASYVLRLSILFGGVTGSFTFSEEASAEPAPASEAGASPVAPLSGAEVTLAETLYREGRLLMAERRYAEACIKFAESHRLDPATGTLLNLGTCHEAQGKLASAWSAFSEALRAARRELREDRVTFAEERLAALEPRLSRLTVQLSPEMTQPVDVKVDGVSIGPAAYGVAVPIDPGSHRVEASAPGHESWSQELRVEIGSLRHVVTIPVLKAARVDAAPPPQAPVPAPLPVIAPQPVEHDWTRPIPTSVYVAGGATLALTAAAIVTGISYLDKEADYANVRGDASVSTGDQRAASDEARTMGWLNLGFSAAAAIGAGVTVYLFATRPKQPVEGWSSSARLSAWAFPGAAGACVRSEF
ncbi:MAG TPA: tetratricopeptide repeat protein [Polyangiaceae bacterium]